MSIANPFHDGEQLVQQRLGQVEIADPTNETNGTRRYWTLFVEQWLELSLPQSFRWELLDYSNQQSVDGCLQ